MFLFLGGGGGGGGGHNMQKYHHGMTVTYFTDLVTKIIGLEVAGPKEAIHNPMHQSAVKFWAAGFIQVSMVIHQPISKSVTM